MIYCANSPVNALAVAIQSAPIVYIPHHDYALVETLLVEALHTIFRYPKPKTQIIEFQGGVGDVSFSDKKTFRKRSENLKHFVEDLAFSHCMEEAGLEIFLLKNVLEEIREDAGIQSCLLHFAQLYEQKCCVVKGKSFNPNKTIIIIDPSGDDNIPPELAKYATLVEIPAPSEDEILQMVDEKDHTLDESDKKTLVRTLKGLDRSDIQHILTSITTWSGGRFTVESYAQAFNEKKKIAKKSGVITVVETDESFDDIGGLDVLRENLERKAVIFNDLNRADQLRVPIPKGVLIIGMPGCGKTMIAKSIARAFSTPLLRLDMNRILGSYVGESEINMRKALDAAETASPCVLWIDEIEKAFSGANNTQGENDDTVMRMMGLFLTWLQEHKDPVFVVATANDQMRPEFMRKGRFDDVFFVDWPNKKELEAILRKQLEWFEMNTAFRFPDLFERDVDGKYVMVDKHRKVKEEICTAAEGFSGSEINGAIRSVLEKVFVDVLEKHRGEEYEFSMEDLTISLDMFKKELQDMSGHLMSLQETEKEDNMVKRMAKLRHQKQFTDASKL